MLEQELISQIAEYMNRLQKNVVLRTNNESHEKKIIKDISGQKRLIHSLGSLNYLKIEPTNHLLFAC